MPDSEMTGNLLFFTSRRSETAATTTASEEIKAEARIVERVRAGDQEAFNELYRMFAPLVHGVVLARGARSDVDDIVQEVFLSAYKNLHSLRDANAVGAWLAIIARNRAAEFYRKSPQTEELSEDLTQSNQPNNAEAREILTAILGLPAAYKETLILRLVEGMSGNEIAEQIGLTPESVRVNLHRGMKLLRQKLGVEERKQ